MAQNLLRHFSFEVLVGAAMRNKWFPITLIYLYGLVGTSALGMMGPLSTDISRTFGVTASAVGMAIAGQLIPLAFAGLLMGWLIDRIGPRPLLLIGLLAMGASSFANSWLETFDALRITLLIEGVALVSLLTSGQGLLMMFTTGKQQVQSLTLWSTVMPVGYSIGLLLVSPYAGGDTWREAFLCHAIIAGCLCFVFLGIPGLRIVSKGNGLTEVLCNKRVLRFGFSLSLSALAGIGSSAVGAIYLSKIHGMEMGLAAQSMAVASLCGILGSIIIGGLLAKGWSAALLAMLILASATIGSFIFYWPSGVLPFVVGGAMLLQLCVGGFIAFVFSLLPRVLSEPGQSGAAAGLVGQITGIGAALSAPLYFTTLQMGHWYYFVVITVLAWGASYLLLPMRSRSVSATARFE
ncbi:MULTISPECIES: MFS transporter [unclassified Pseudomonas]|uniref:MFS transporter n=1 Tax=unclassified Pseudomonas TaxID=196821 RepID=UPI00088F0C09|nr:MULTISPECIES: MFS transporter [unclassified Pseudomonas]SCZ05958.1 Sugar phosphate permease [Pseudomonas sp. NFACC37-1]SFO82390.1 Sugar phosphate permease [Pseudomonas sp. NFACC24-1]